MSKLLHRALVVLIIAPASVRMPSFIMHIIYHNFFLTFLCYNYKDIRKTTSLHYYEPGFSSAPPPHPPTPRTHNVAYNSSTIQNMFHNLTPVIGGFGLKMLQKMGWKEGQPLGTSGRGHTVPIAVNIKIDRSGEKIKIQWTTSLQWTS